MGEPRALLWRALGAALASCPICPFLGSFCSSATSGAASPARTAMMFIICALAAAVLAWCWFGRIDIYATARGSGPVLSVIGAILLFAELPSGTALLGIAIVILGVVAARMTW